MCLVGFRMLLLETPGYDTDFSSRLFNRDAGFESGNRAQVSRASLRVVIGFRPPAGRIGLQEQRVTKEAVESQRP